MKIIFVLAMLIPLFSKGQSDIIKGSADIQTFLYKSPGPDPYYSKRFSDTIKSIQPNDLIAIYGIIDTNINGKIQQWAKTVYHMEEGFIYLNHITLSNQSKEQLKLLDSNDESILLNKAYEFSKIGFKSDSLRTVKKLMEKQENELLLIKAKKEDSIYIIKFRNAIIKEGFHLAYSKFTEKKYSVDFSVIVNNLSEKDIKYIWFTLQFMNPVGDLIEKKIVKAVGPIATLSTFVFEDVLYTKLFNTGYIEKIKIEYMNGTTKNYTSSDLDKISLYRDRHPF